MYVISGYRYSIEGPLAHNFVELVKEGEGYLSNFKTFSLSTKGYKLNDAYNVLLAVTIKYYV